MNHAKIRALVSTETGIPESVFDDPAIPEIHIEEQPARAHAGGRHQNPDGSPGKVIPPGTVSALTRVRIGDTTFEVDHDVPKHGITRTQKDVEDELTRMLKSADCAGALARLGK